MSLFIQNLWAEPRYFFAVVLIVVLSVCAHEFMHAFVALKMGDPTAADRGHLTMNPFKQMGLSSLLMLCFIGLAWGQVPVNPANFRSRFGRGLTAAAGPLTNLILGGVFGFLAFWCERAFSAEEFASQMLITGAVLNVVLFLLNILPLPGFDGWNLVACFFPRLERVNSQFFLGSMFAFLLLILLFFQYFFTFGVLVISLEFRFLGLLFG